MLLTSWRSSNSKPPQAKITPFFARMLTVLPARSARTPVTSPSAFVQRRFTLVSRYTGTWRTVSTAWLYTAHRFGPPPRRVPGALVDTLQGIVADNSNRLRTMIFKWCVELNMMGHTIAAHFRADPINRRELRAYAVDEVKRTNGQISFDRALDQQRRLQDNGL